MAGHARARSFGRKYRSRAWSTRRIDPHYRSPEGHYLATPRFDQMAESGRKGQFSALRCSHSAGCGSFALMASSCTASTCQLTARRRLPRSSSSVDRSFALATDGRMDGSFRPPPTLTRPNRPIAANLSGITRHMAVAHGRQAHPDAGPGPSPSTLSAAVRRNFQLARAEPLARRNVVRPRCLAADGRRLHTRSPGQCLAWRCGPTRLRTLGDGLRPDSPHTSRTGNLTQRIAALSRVTGQDRPLSRP